MKNNLPRLVQKPRLGYLLSIVSIVQLLVVCLVAVFAYIGARAGWGSVSDQQPNFAELLLLFIFMLLSAVIRYICVYLVSWSMSKHPVACLRAYKLGLGLNILFDLFQAWVLIATYAAPQVDGGFALLIIPLGGFWTLVGSIAMSGAARFILPRRER